MKNKMKTNVQPTETIEQILAVVKDPVKRVVAGHKAGLNVGRETYNMVANPENISGFFWSHEYNEMLSKLEEGGISIPNEAVESCVAKAYPHCFEYGLDERIKEHLRPEFIQRKGLEVYNWMINEHKQHGSENWDICLGKRNKVISSFDLQQEATLDLDRIAFTNALSFGNSGKWYPMTDSNADTVDKVLSNSHLRILQNELGLNQEQVSDIVSDYVRNVLKGRNVSKARYHNNRRRRMEAIECAYGMLLDFGEKLGLTDAEERKLAEMYKSTEYARMQFVEKYFPEEVTQWRKDKEETDENLVFTSFYPKNRENIKQSEPFDSERFRNYDQACFRQALEDGNFDFAYQIAVERGYKEAQLLKLK